MREANDRGDERLLVEDGAESYFPEFEAQVRAGRPGRRRSATLALAGANESMQAGAETLRLHA